MAIDRRFHAIGLKIVGVVQNRVGFSRGVRPVLSPFQGLAERGTLDPGFRSFLAPPRATIESPHPGLRVPASPCE